jgi:hypothetical protein
MRWKERTVQVDEAKLEGMNVRRGQFVPKVE